MRSQSRHRTAAPDSFAANDIERRREQRAPAKDWILTLTAAGQTHPFMLRNISGKGAAGSTTAPVQIGSKVELKLEDGRSASGVVRWVRSGMVGIALAFPLPQTVVQEHARALKSRAPRYRTERGASVTAGGTRRLAVIRNVSKGGAEIETALSLKKGQLLTLECRGVLPIECEVRWCAGARMGIQFLSWASLEQFSCS